MCFEFSEVCLNVISERRIELKVDLMNVANDCSPSIEPVVVVDRNMCQLVKVFMHDNCTWLCEYLLEVQIWRLNCMVQMIC